jgi:hypothetical protein
LRLPASVGARAAEPRSRRQHDPTSCRAVERLELMSQRDAGLMDVASDDQLGASCNEAGKDGVARRQRSLARGPPGRADEVVVASDDAQGTDGRRAELRGCALDALWNEPSRLLAPGTGGVEADDDECLRAVCRIGRADGSLPFRPGTREAGRKRVGQIVIAGDGEERDVGRLEDPFRRLELAPAATVREVAGREQHLGPHLRRQGGERLLEAGRLAPARVEIGDVERAGHDPGEAIHSAAMSESPEIFDDLYLGLRAGGAMRKRRRGEELTVEEAEALGRWHRLSIWRKSVAIGAFAVGTFGLGFTLGGLVFGRWRKA